MRFIQSLLVAAVITGSSVEALSAQITLQRPLASERLGLTWTGTNASLPKILILFTGGTIAGGSNTSRLDDTQYGQLQITAEDIIDRNSYLYNVSQLAVSNWTTVDDGSTGTNDALVMNMTRFAHDALCSADSDIAGAVFTHGSNSLEETAFLMDALVNCGKPVVGTGAMRPWTGLSYDGDANFFQAVSLAASDEARDRGALIAFNNRILSAFWATKMTPNVPDAFGSTSGGELGAFLNNMPYFYATPSTPYQKHFFDLDLVSNHSSYPSLPKVDILYTMREFDGQLVLDCIKNGAQGVLIGGTGNGGLPNGSKQVAEALALGLKIVVGSRSPFGPSSPSRDPTYAKSGYVHLPQARIMLQLAIASGFDQNQIIELFESSLRKAIGQPFTY